MLEANSTGSGSASAVFQHPESVATVAARPPDTGDVRTTRRNCASAAPPSCRPAPVVSANDHPNARILAADMCEQATTAMTHDQPERPTKAEADLRQ